MRDAFARFGEMPHAAPVGTLREDLLVELQSFRTAMVDPRLDRALAVLAERAPAVPELGPVRGALIVDGERPLRDRLSPLLAPGDVDVAVRMLAEAVLHAVLMHKQPADDFLAAAVDAVVRGLALDPTA